jgi:hypothetical protein
MYPSVAGLNPTALLRAGDDSGCQITNLDVGSLRCEAQGIPGLLGATAGFGWEDVIRLIRGSTSCWLVVVMAGPGLV